MSGMKNKLILLAAAVCILLCSLVFYQVENTGSWSRVHQHITAAQQEQATQTGAGLVTHLPIVELQTDGQNIPGGVLLDGDGEKLGYELSETGEKTITASFFLRNEGTGRNTLATEPYLRTLAQIRYRGNSSRYFDKHAYAVHFVDEKGNENPQAVEGMASHNEWVLNGPILDRTLIRNYLCLNVAGEIMEYAPNVRFCELVVNGEYQGVYLMLESIALGEGRIEISKPEKNKDMTSWIVRWDRAGKGDQELDNYAYYTYRSDVSALDVRYPGKNKITSGRMEYIRSDISKVERALYSYDLSDTQKGYASYLDAKSFAQYFIINEFFRNVDAGRFSTFYYKDVRGKIKPCVWDFNNACDNYVDYDWDEAGFTMQNAPWFSALLRDKDFVKEIVTQYRRLRKGVLNDAYLLTYIDETISFLGDAVDRNYTVWGSMFDLSKYDGMMYLTPVTRNVTSYTEAITQLKTFIQKRGSWLDEHIDTLYQYCQDSKNANSIVY